MNWKRRNLEKSINTAVVFASWITLYDFGCTGMYMVLVTIPDLMMVDALSGSGT